MTRLPDSPVRAIPNPRARRALRRLFSAVSLAAALATAWLHLDGSTAHACSCMAQTVEQARDDAHAIFEGHVTEVQSTAEGDVGGGADLRVALKVVRAFKGLEDVDDTTVFTRDNSAACGYPFETNKSYLVYAHRGDDGTFGVSLCSRTQPIETAQEDLAVLGMGVTTVNPSKDPAVKPTEPSASTGSTSSAGCQSCSVGTTPARDHTGQRVSMLAALVLGGLLVRRGRRRSGG